MSEVENILTKLKAMGIKELLTDGLKWAWI